MTISLEQLSAQMRRGEQVPLRHTMQVVLTLSIPSILQQIVVAARHPIEHIQQVDKHQSRTAGGKLCTSHCHSRNDDKCRQKCRHGIKYCYISCGTDHIL